MPTSMSDNQLYNTGDVEFEPGKPSGADNLTALYGLTDLASSVARFDPETGEKRKLRKSYKNQIAHLAGKHIIPGPGETPAAWSLTNIARQAPRFDPGQPPPELAKIDGKTLSYGLAFDRSPIKGIPDFNVSLLAADFGKASSASPEAEPVKNKFGIGISFTKKQDLANGAGSLTAESSNDDNPVLRKSKKKRSKELTAGVSKRQKLTTNA